MAYNCVKAVATGNLAIFQMTFKEPGEFNDGHAHSYHHLLLVAAGRVRVESNDRASEYGEHEIVWIPRGVAHRYVPLEFPTVAYCIQALHKRDDVGDVLDDAAIPGGTPDWLVPVPLLQGDARRQIADFDALIEAARGARDVR